MYVNNLGLNIPKELQESPQVANESQQLGKNDFMQLLIAQMQNQDPLEPKSNTESIAQMAQFSSLEQNANLVKSFENFAKTQSMNSLATSAHVIGKYATIQNGAEEMTGKVVSTSLSNGEVLVKLEMEEGKEVATKLSSIVALQEKMPEKKEYKTLPVTSNKITNI
jgi:flagellar basal-body rod modification protein FlgD